jgi:hypothetical protein
VALEYFLASGAQLCAVLLQTLLDGTIITQVLTAKARSVARTRLLLLRSSGTILRQGLTRAEQSNYEGESRH